MRALFNVRPPAPVPMEFQRIEGELLEAMTAAKGIVEGMDLPASGLDARFVLWQGDITRLRVIFDVFEDADLLRYERLLYA